MNSDGKGNVAMLLTPPGAAAIAVVRIIGARVRDFLRCHFSKPLMLGRCVHGILSDGEEMIDEPVVVLLDEKRADINVHGGPWVIEATLELARRFGFEIIDSS